MDNIVSKNTEHGQYDYGYDELYRLTSSSVSSSGSSGGSSEAFTYDNVGNRLSSSDTTGSWTYNDNNELGGYDNVSYQYDANGNMTQVVNSGVTTTYVYNVENRLSEVRDSTGSLIAEYYYDLFGRRLWKDVGGTKTYFLYSDEGLIGEYDGTGAEIKTYGYKPGSTWTTDPLFMKQGGNYYFYHNDHLGTPQKMTSVNGAVVWSAKYEAFGKADVNVTSTITNNLRFSGQYYDEETGWHYNYNRYYDSMVGRYHRSDPMGIIASFNYYPYASNDPMGRIDPLGLWNYEAYCRYISGGELAGGGVLKCQIKGPCRKGNKREVIMTNTIFVGATIGLPGGWTYFFITLTDNNAIPDVRNLLGWSYIASGGYAYPGGGRSIAKLRLGDGYADTGLAEQTGFLDATIDLMFGHTGLNHDVPINYWLEDCCYTGFEI